MSFHIPAPIGPDVPLNTMHVFQWARTAPREDVTVFKYLASLGFRVGIDRITKDEYECLQYACECFHRTEPHIPETLGLSDVLTPAESGGFYVQGLSGRWVPTARVIDTLARAGWIYDVAPETTYFALSNGVLWARYQSIIGSRPIARVAQ